MALFKAFQEASLFMKFMLLLFFMVVFCCLSLFVAAIIMFVIVGGDIHALLQAMSANAPVSMLKILQAAQTIGLFLLPPFAVALFLENEKVKFLKIKNIELNLSALAVVMVFFSFPLINWLGGINQKMHLPSFLSGIEDWMRLAETQAADLTQKFLAADSIGVLLVNILIMAVLPAIGEELLFRGVIQQYLLKGLKNKHVAVWVTAIIFSAFHMQFFGFFPRMILGAVLGYLFVWSGNLWYSVFFHFTNNCLAVLAYYFFQKGAISTNPETIATQPSDVWIVIATVPFLLLFLRKFWLQSKLK
jgi:membrane protease YdiL (CAAX protease family)